MNQRDYIGKRGGLPTPWSEGCWKVFIDTKEQCAAAIAYVERHPVKEGLPKKRWPFVPIFVGEFCIGKTLGV